LAEILRDHPLSGSSAQGNSPIKDRILLSLDYINGNLSKKITLTAAAEQAAMGRTQYTVHFKHLMGMPFSKYITKCRLEGARFYLIANKDKFKLDAIAKQWGFYDYSHLIKLYRQYFGKTPSQENSV
jgi:transcriptional regulator GlxA family with amidase domain